MIDKFINLYIIKKVVKMRIEQVEGIGINLIAEDQEEERQLERFWNSGVKVNSLTHHSKGSSLQLTYADLIRR
jgi:hypothetical protein